MGTRTALDVDGRSGPHSGRLGALDARTADLLDEFQKRCGYNLADHLPALVNRGADEETMIDRLEFTGLDIDPWQAALQIGKQGRSDEMGREKGCPGREIVGDMAPELTRIFFVATAMMLGFPVDEHVARRIDLTTTPVERTAFLMCGFQ